MPTNPKFHFSSSVKANAGDTLEFEWQGLDGKSLLNFPAEAFDVFLAKQHAGYSEIEWELLDSKQSFSKTTEFENDDHIKNALFVDAVMSYGRVFATAEGRSGIKLDGTSHWLGGDESSSALHEKLMEFRNTLIAHSGQTALRSCQSYIVTSLHESGVKQVMPNSLPKSISFGIGTLKFSMFAVGSKDITTILNHIDSIVRRVQVKVESLQNKITTIAAEKLIEK